MDLHEFKKKTIKENLGIKDEFGVIHAFIDFANVNKWLERDEFAEDGILLPKDQRLTIDLQKLRDFLCLFAEDARFYYGTDPANSGSTKFMGAARHIFDKRRVFTKPVQKIKHYLDDDEFAGSTRAIQSDATGSYITIPKSNFDVEITLDVIRTAGRYNTLCLLSGDSDFAPLLRYVKNLGKKTILIKSGFIQDNLRRFSDIVINAQDIKPHIAFQKQKPGS